MAEQHQIAADLVADRASATTDPVKLLTGSGAGRTITAEIDGSPDATMVLTELGEDYRNLILLHVTADADAAWLSAGDQVQFTLFGALVTCRILKRRDGGAQVQTDYWAMQLTDKDS